MRTTSPTVTQTTCDHDGPDGPCDTYAVTGHLRPKPAAVQRATHQADLQADGWTDLEGRDYCPDHKPTP